MRIWYQSMTQARLFGSYQAALRKMVDQARDAATEVVIHALEDTGGLGKQYHYLEHLQATEMLRNVETATQQGYDAFVIGHFTDAGIKAAREITDMPIIGLGESSMHIACMMGKKFSLIGINRKSLACIEDNVHAYCLDGRMASAETMHLDDPAMLEQALSNAESRDRTLRAFEQAALDCEASGGEVMIPAGGILMALLASTGLHRTRRGSSIVNGVAVAIKTSEMAVNLRRIMGGAFTSKSLSYAPPSLKELKQIHECYGTQVYQSL